MTDEQNPESPVEADPYADALAAADRADAERDVSMLAMVGLLVLIVGIGLAAWGATTPGFFQGPADGVAIGCQSSTRAGPDGGFQEQTICRANVDGKEVTGPPEDINRLVAAAREESADLASPEQRFWAGMLLILVGVVITAWGFVRARRAAA